MPAELKRFLLVYSSQTGQAQAIAEEIAEKAGDHGLQADIHCISQTEKKFWLERERLVVLITSTTGDGDPPDTAGKFWRRLKKKTLERTHLSHLRFALLGLGDTNYSNFCNCAKSFYKRLQELGAVPFVEPGWADDAVGLEVAVEPWLEGLFPALRKELYEDLEAGTLQALCVPNSDCTDNEKNKDLNGAVTNGAPANGSISDNRTNDSIKAGNLENSTNIRPDGSSSELKIIEKMESEMSSAQNAEAPSTGPIDTPDSSNVSEKQTKTDSHVVGGSDPQTMTPSDIVCDSDQQTGITSDIVRDSVPQTKNNPDKTPTNQVQPAGGDARSHPPQPSTSSRAGGPGGGGDPGGALSGGTLGVTEQGVKEKQEGLEETLARSVPPLSESPLTLPVLPPAYLKLTHDSTSHVEEGVVPELQNGCPLPSAKSEVAMATVVKAHQLTRDDAVKKTLKLTLSLQDAPWAGDWCPGDSFGLLCPNPEGEVDALLKRLGVDPDTPYSLAVIPGTKKRAAAVPPHLPTTGTLRQAFTYCCDIRSPPKKALLRCLVEHTSTLEEKRRLQELSSKQGAASYTRLLREPGVGLSDMLTAFPSCTPPVERLLEHLPRLLPRPYSAASCPAEGGREVDFAFNVVNIPAGGGRTEHRSGVCTGHLDRLTSHIQVKPGQDLHTRMEQLSITDIPKIPMYLRSNQYFRPCDDLSQPVVMIGPGTGVAPFVGFLQYRAQGLTKLPSDADVGECWLFFGCRHKERDYIFREELERFESLGMLSKLLVSFSRDGAEGEETDRPRYVQDLMKQQGGSLVKLIVDKKALVYVCGDAQGMARGVNDAFNNLLQTYRGFTEKEAAEYVVDMRLSKRYREDVWT